MMVSSEENAYLNFWIPINRCALVSEIRCCCLLFVVCCCLLLLFVVVVLTTEHKGAASASKMHLHIAQLWQMWL